MSDTQALTVAAALTEAGFPGHSVGRGPTGELSVELTAGTGHRLPALVVWRAFFVAGRGTTCWSCFERNYTVHVGAPCEHEVVWR